MPETPIQDKPTSNWVGNTIIVIVLLVCLAVAYAVIKVAETMLYSAFPHFEMGPTTIVGVGRVCLAIFFLVSYGLWLAMQKLEELERSISGLHDQLRRLRGLD